jgi:hypothetical protein
MYMAHEHMIKPVLDYSSEDVAKGLQVFESAMHTHAHTHTHTHTRTHAHAHADTHTHTQHVRAHRICWHVRKC